MNLKLKKPNSPPPSPCAWLDALLKQPAEDISHSALPRGPGAAMENGLPHLEPYESDGDGSEDVAPTIQATPRPRDAMPRTHPSPRSRLDPKSGVEAVP